MKRSIVITVILSILLFSGICIIENAAAKARPSFMSDHSSSSIYALAGEFRTVFANLLWIKADIYHHEFLLKNGDWSQNKEMTGLLQIITMLDPHFEEAYEVGAYIYAYGYKDSKRALDYLRKGIAANPDAWELYRIAALLYAWHLREPDKALPYAIEALKRCNDDFYRKTIMRMLKSIQRNMNETKADRSSQKNSNINLQ